ncbi:MAG: hypothetical protein V3W04_09555 [Gammaproteobacteria bacterium]
MSFADQRVPEMYSEIGRYCDVPGGLLYALARAESGKSTHQSFEPWPWTLNIEGQGHYYENRDTMFDALMQAITQGRQVDIGLTQLNWHWKYDRLISPWQATDPVFNLKTACNIVREHYDNAPEKGWFHATGKYHRESDSPASLAIRHRYSERVRQLWGQK